MTIARYAPMCYATSFKTACALTWYMSLLIAAIAIWFWITHKRIKDV